MRTWFPPLVGAWAVSLVSVAAAFSQDAGWKRNSDETCEGRRAIIERMGAGTEVAVEAAAVAAGKAITIDWKRGRFPSPCSDLFAMFSA